MSTATASFLPDTFNAADWPSVSAQAQRLLERSVAGEKDLTSWFVDRSDFLAACSEARAERYIAMTCRTDDESAAGEWTRYIEQVAPKLKAVGFDLDKRTVELAGAVGLDDDRHAVLLRDTREDVELFREENIPLETELARLDQQYDAICAAQTVLFQGEERTLPQMARFLEESDRALRETAWRAGQQRRLQDGKRIEDIFGRMIALRAQLGANAGFPNYRDFAFRRMHRFDYTPDDCARFHDACEKTVVPLLRDLDRERAAALSVSPLRPWDLAVDVKSRAPLRPFDGADELVDGCSRIFHRMDPALGAMFDELRSGDCLDLESRKGKAPGGYQYMRDYTRRPFIFMNAAGMHGDVHTMLHEAGHAFHSQLCRDEPLVEYRHSPIEFAEVASMSMELLSMPYWDEFYDSEEQLRRAQREQLEGVVNVLPWIATIDAFQHWVYTHPKHTRDERTAFWRTLNARFGHEVEWLGLEPFRDGGWRRQGHLFGSPFYYIEYGIAQLGALQLWLRARREGLDVALDAYKRALSLGGSRPLPELFSAAGIDFDFGPATVGRLMDELRAALDELPD